MSKKILVVAAHPDDEVIGCAGTIKKFTDSGNEVHLIVGSDGVSSRNTNKSEYIKRNEALENIEHINEIGTQWTIKQSEELINAGVPIIHYYLMNDTSCMLKILKHLHK